MHFLQCLDPSHELEDVMSRVVSTDITFEGTPLNQDTRPMVQQSKVGITSSAIDGVLILEYEDMFTGKCSKLSRSQCLCLGRIEIPKVRRFPSVLSLRRLKLHGIKRRKVPKIQGLKNMKRNILWLANNQAVFDTPKELLCKEF